MDENPYAAPGLEASLPAREAHVHTGSMPWFAVGTRKLFVMTLLTFGLYLIHWFERQYRFQKRTWGDASWPLARGIFSVLFANELFRRVERAAKAIGIQPSWRARTMATLFVVSAILGRVFDQISATSTGIGIAIVNLLTLFGLAYPLYRVQATVNALLEREFGNFERNERFTVWNWIMMACGAVAFVFLVAGMTMQ